MCRIIRFGGVRLTAFGSTAIFIGVGFNVLPALGVPADDDFHIALTNSELQVQISREVVLRYRAADNVCFNHVL